MKNRITDCVRCGRTHKEVQVQELKRPVVYLGLPIATHYATCPTNNQPILMIERTDEVKFR